MHHHDAGFALVYLLRVQLVQSALAMRHRCPFTPKHARPRRDGLSGGPGGRLADGSERGASQDACCLGPAPLGGRVAPLRMSSIRFFEETTLPALIIATLITGPSLETHRPTSTS